MILGAITMALLLPYGGYVARANADADPVLDSMSTWSAPVGTTVTFTGSNFGSSKPTSFVTFAGVRAEVVSWSDTQVRAVVPVRATAGYAGVTVDNVTSNGKWFSPAQAPLAYRLSADMAPVGSRVTIYGKGFGSSQRTGWVTFSSTDPREPVRASVVSWSDSQIVVTVPPGSVTGWVGVWQSGSCSNGLLFFAGERPAIDDISTDVVFPGETVTITGTDFGSAPAGADSLTLSGTPIDPASWSDTEITVRIPRGAKSGYLGVWRNGVSSNGAHLYVAPKITSVSESWGEPGSRLTITGSDFGPSATRVTLGDTEMPVVSWTDTRIEVAVPDVAEGYIGVWRDQACSNGKYFWPVKKPKVDKVTPDEDGTVVIQGADFGTADGTSKATIDTAQMQVMSWSDTRIVAKLPADTTQGYVGVWKRFVASKGVWVDTTP